MKKPQKLLYLEHYPHFLVGVKNSTLHLTREKLRELNTLPEKEVEERVEKIPGIDNTFAFYELLRTEDVSDVLKEVGKRGFWVGMWEEGSYAICKPEYKQKCIDKITLQEAKVNAAVLSTTTATRRAATFDFVVKTLAQKRACI